jgi:hypothetical protein
MATVIGDRDVLLLGSSQRALNPLGADILLQLSAPLFKVDTSGNPLPSTITVTANLISLTGTVSFSATGATVTNNNDNTATVAYSSLTGNACTITASLTSNGQVFNRSVQITKFTDGSKGDNGTSGNQYATVYLYQWSASTPAKPNGTSGYTWATGINSTYNGTDQWQITATNPGTPGLKLYVAAVQITAAGGTASTVVFYTNASVQVWAQNGNNGVSGYQSATIQVYRWDSSTAPAGPAGTGTYTWSSGDFGAAPTSPTVWTLAPGIAPSQGLTLWAAKLQIIDSATVTQTAYNWTSAAIVAVGSSGSNGDAGPSGASYVTAYCASTTGTTSTAPAQTTGKTSLPATNDGGITGTWSSTVPALSVNQYLYQSDGIYDPTTNKVTWSIPYWSSLKVGSLSAITANLGSINAGSIDLGSGKIVLQNDGTATFRKITIVDDSTGATILNAGGLSAAYAAPGTLNSQQQWSEVGGTGRPADNATSDVTLIGYNHVSVVGNRAVKNGGDNSWDSQFQSLDGFIGGAYASAKIDVPGLMMFGLNIDPDSDADYRTIDYAIYPFSDGNLYAYNNGTPLNSGNSIGSYSTGDVLSVIYDGTKLYWIRNGAVLYTYTPPARITAPLYIDSSFCSAGAALSNIRFGPMTSNNFADVGGSTKPENNATVGAPAGTNVGSTSATTVESNAANGNTAYNAVNDATNGLAQKLKANAQNILSGSAGLATGNLAWDGSGNRTSGYGVGMNQKGIVAYNSSGVATFTLDGTTGNATFAGQLAAAYGTFGSVSIASGGYVASGQTAYNTGTGFFLGFNGSTPVFSLGIANGTGIRWDGTTLTVQNPTVSSPFSATVTSTSSSYTVSRTATNGFGGTYTANPANGTGPYSYSWSVGTSGISRGWVGGSSTGQQAQLSIESNGRASGDQQDFYMTCVVTDTASNISKTITYLTTIYFS